MHVEPFLFSASKEQLDDLKTRITLGLKRIPAPIPGTEWEYGTKKDVLLDLVNYWKDSYDWKSAEKRIFGDFKHFVADVNDIKLHFIHERSERPDALPLILIHGWPGSFYEFIELIKELAHPSNPSDPAFHIVVPSLPGYGFSSAPQVKGFGIPEMAKTFDQLMSGLGYAKYFAQGDMFICTPPAPGITTLWTLFKAILWNFGAPIFSKEEDNWLKSTQDFQRKETAYQEIQGTKPQSLGYALNDSPVGLCAWILEKFSTWGESRGDVLGHFGRDRILTNIMIYWLSGSITSSMRLYYEVRHNPASLGAILTTYHKPPVAIANFAEELYRAPKEWAEHVVNLQQWSVFPSGGHFAAMEEPALLLADVRKFFGRKDIASQIEGGSKLNESHSRGHLESTDDPHESFDYLDTAVEEELMRLYTGNQSDSTKASRRTHPHHRLACINFDWTLGWDTTGTGPKSPRKSVSIAQNPGTHFGGGARTGNVCWRSGMVLAKMFASDWGRSVLREVSESAMRSGDGNLRVLELGSGTGLLAVTHLLTLFHGLPALFPNPRTRLPTVHLTLTDSDMSALSVARKNILENLDGMVLEADGLGTRPDLKPSEASTKNPKRSRIENARPPPTIFVSFVHLDWTLPATYPSFSSDSPFLTTRPSLILATDTAYNEFLADSFAQVARHTMGIGDSVGATKGSTLIVAQELRSPEPHRALLRRLLNADAEHDDCTSGDDVCLYRIPDDTIRGACRVSQWEGTMNEEEDDTFAEGVVVYVMKAGEATLER
ncbi:hypothetical protein HDU93_009322 [Gonapodya sp. JEL0774]|nr:hypothetical protein HDU93_009322 [Gonapodya sp. JEL0774]